MNNLGGKTLLLAPTLGFIVYFLNLIHLPGELDTLITTFNGENMKNNFCSSEVAFRQAAPPLHMPYHNFPIHWVQHGPLVRVGGSTCPPHSQSC